ncbi:hypothetical protein [Sphingomonas sp. S-NIH.Pt15_0812]|jgi:hypothetical protein|uniref:hypothetical protein n=1 Tax=Sphingomonas sp. S-NIH.Pt15_0812 TaxID=1920129 RepID=UPI000F7ED131|nr:hypothetical protein [Sphingomonas sp. S-NIH.Pt15_0812]
MALLKTITPAPVQAFTTRSDLTNAALRTFQGLTALGLSIEIAHAGMSAPLTFVLGTGVILAQTIAWVGWKNEHVRHVQAAARATTTRGRYDCPSVTRLAWYTPRVTKPKLVTYTICKLGVTFSLAQTIATT